ncbi:hypothetical protein [Yinghuangia seranimata]|uniref:hypothetical protein n=1 Tax=Yinghuangia seranimata TaxID=408067 RepID=UPI00248BAA1A|nr:hypothetical protein [Yinghuangia seranimata]MDI2130830.1 hypothetical protein [Yinghuangia seranimata]
MNLSLDPDRGSNTYDCECCNVPIDKVWGFIRNDGEPYAVFYANCYHHGDHDVWIDVIFGTWGTDTHTDHITFGCRVGPIPGEAAPAASLVPAASTYPDDALFGLKLDRDSARAHPRLADFWTAVDYLLENEPTVSAHLYGPRQA